MKRYISIILSISIIILTMNIGFTAYAEELENKAVDNFIEGICDVIRDYDSDKEFIAEDVNALDSESTSETQNFQTCRLIVKASGGFDTHGAVRHIKGYDGMHILQYENEIEAEKAYNAFLNEKNLLSVSVDKIVSPTQADEVDDTVSDVFPESSNGHLCDWATEQTQSAYVQDYVKKNNIPLEDVTVAVIDSGVDYNHEFLKDRIIRTHFNSTPDGIENDELDLVDGHGTAVSGTVIDNSLDNVKIAVYRVLNDEGDNTIAGICAGIYQAVQDSKNNEISVDLMNISLGYIDEDDLTKSAVTYANNMGVQIVSGAGNMGQNNGYFLNAPACFDSVFTVAASDINMHDREWSNYGFNVDISAPGETVNVAIPNNSYNVWDGTSFASPAVAGMFAMIKAIYPNWSNERITATFLKEAVPLEVYYCDTNHLEHKFDFGEKCKGNSNGFIQMGNALGLTQTKAPEIVTKSGNYDNSVTVTIKPNSNSDKIYYTTDLSYPTVNDNLYIEPFTVSEDTIVRAVSYNENNELPYSTEDKEEYRIFTVGTDDMFTIDETGCITSYSGNIRNLRIPDYINGIEVKTFTPKIFNVDTLEGLILAKGIDEISKWSFAQNENLKYFNSTNATVIGVESFYYSHMLQNIDLPNVISIDKNAFYAAKSFGHYCISVYAPKVEIIHAGAFKYAELSNIYCPKLKTLSNNAFYMCNFRYLDFPNLDETIIENAIGGTPIDNCSLLMNVSAPKLKKTHTNLFKGAERLEKFDINNCETRFFDCDLFGLIADEIYADGLKSIEQDVFNYETYEGKNIRLKNLESINFETNIFGEYPVERIEFSNLKTTTSLPMNEGAKIAMPSTFTECTEDTKGRNYLVYGTSGTYAESWAKENNHTFIPISQETAIMNELDSEYYGWGELEFDVIGFNKNYTWYGCYDEYGKNAVALCDEIDGKFNPLDYEAYPYYYCVCTSTDGDSIVEIKSSVSKNIDYVAPKYSVDALGGSIRVTDAGMRFGFSLDKAQNADVEEYGFVYSFERTGELKADDENVYTTTAPNRIDHGENITFNLVFTSVPPEAYDQIASARAYIKVDGEYYYSPILQRSFNQISNAVLNDDEIDEVTKNTLRSLFIKEVA